MSDHLFGTDGIRGPAGVYPLDGAGATQIGRAIAALFLEPGDEVVLGWDPRESSAMIVEAVSRGLVAMGATVQQIGMLPTPGLAYVTKRRGIKIGVMVTASHNPYTDNGIKVFTAGGTKLTDGQQLQLNTLIVGEIAERAAGSVVKIPEAITEYEDFLVASADETRLDGLQIITDSANGATSGIAARVFERLGASVTPIFYAPDGRNINVECGATDTRALQTAVTVQAADLGAAFDGDGDRLVLVDERGRELDGDYIMYILAVAGSQAGVVATIMSNRGLETALASHSIVVERVGVGDRAVIEGLARSGYRLGGEQSGHIIISDYANTGDGLLAAIQICKQVVISGKSLAQWHDELELLPQALLSIPFADKRRFEDPSVQAIIEHHTKELGSTGRLNIRLSGTEPKARIMVEAPDASMRAQAIADDLMAALAAE